MECFFINMGTHREEIGLSMTKPAALETSGLVKNFSITLPAMVWYRKFTVQLSFSEIAIV